MYPGSFTRLCMWDFTTTNANKVSHTHAKHVYLKGIQLERSRARC